MNNLIKQIFNLFLFMALIISSFLFIDKIYASQWLIDFWNTITDSNLYNFANISWTAYLNFNWQEDNTVYRVFIDTWNLESVIWTNLKTYQCFRIIWTGYTDTLWEVYFNYKWKNTYICADGKWRWYAKLWAWWWIEFEDTDADSQAWKIFQDLNKDIKDKDFTYSSLWWTWSWTWYAFSDGIWLWVWNYVKTQVQPREQAYDFVDLSKSVLSISSWKKGDWMDVANMEILLKTSNWSDIWWFYSKYIKFHTWDSIFWYDDKTWLRFSWLKDQITDIKFDINGKYSTWVTSVLPYSWAFEIIIWYENKALIMKWEAKFDPPFWFDLKVSDGDWDWKILIWSKENAELKQNITSTAISNLTVLDTNIYISWTSEYVIWWWQSASLIDPFVIRFEPKNNYIVDDRVSVNYKIEWKYDIIVDWNLLNDVPFLIDSSKIIFYADKEISKVEQLSSSCENKFWNWKDNCLFWLILFNSKWYIIPNLNFDMNIEDANKLSTDKYSSFDIDELTPWYDNGLIINSKDSSSNTSWVTFFSISSYKPVYEWKLLLSLSNISGNPLDLNWAQPTFNTQISWLNFWQVVEIYFSWVTLTDGVMLDEDNHISLIYKKISPLANISNPYYNLKWNIQWCSDCSFQKWNSFNWNSFWQQEWIILINWSKTPELISYYSDDYWYSVNWNNWLKNVRLKPNVYINSRWLAIIGKFFGLWLLWLWNRSYWDIWKYWWFNTVWKLITSTTFFNEYKSKLFGKIRWEYISEITHDTGFQSLNDWFKIYRCKQGTKVFLSDDVPNFYINWNNEYVFINCSIHIKSNIYNSSWSKLKIISVVDEDTYIDLFSPTWWKTYSNIYIYPNVTTIASDLMTDGSILTSANTDSADFEDIFKSQRYNEKSLKKQLYIRWKLVSRNTLWGWILIDDIVTFPWSKQIKAELLNVFQSNIKAEYISQAFDMNFWRGSFSNDMIYQTWNLSKIIYETFGCTWNPKKDNKLCLKPIILEYER